MELAYGHMTPSRLKEQRELFLDCFPETANSSVAKEEHYNWKFKTFPYPHQNQPSFEYTADSNGQMLGYYAAIPYRYHYQGNVIPIGMVCDVMTSSKSRGKGVFTKLGSYATSELKKEGFAFTTGYPIRPEVIPGHMKVGWIQAQKLPMYVKVIGLKFLLSKVKLGFFPDVTKLLIRLLYFPIDFLGLFSRKKIRILSPDQLIEFPGYERFLAATSSQASIYLNKDKNFLKWRLSAPGTEYRIACAFDSKESISDLAIVRKVTLENIECLAILDLVSIKPNIYTLAKLQGSIYREARRAKCDLIVTMISAFWAKKYMLIFSGYIRTHKVFTLIVKSLNFNQPESFLKDAKNWHLMWIDSDDL